MTNKILRLLILVFIDVFQSCSIVNPKETIPTYIEVDSVIVKPTNFASHGSVSNKITDVWVYYNRDLLGAYELPAKIPILTDKRGELELVAGIYNNGLSGTRVKYPFYTIDTFSFDASAGSIIKHRPTFTYRNADSQAISYFIDDFEQGNSFVRRNGDTTFVKTGLSSEVFEGDWSNKLELFDTIKFGESISLQEFSFKPNKPCYIELNYKSDIPFYIRTLVKKSGINTTLDLIGIKANSSWNKIYIDFGQYPNAYQNATFQFIIDATLTDGRTKGTVLIDNFKIINYK